MNQQPLMQNDFGNGGMVNPGFPVMPPPPGAPGYGMPGPIGIPNPNSPGMAGVDPNAVSLPQALGFCQKGVFIKQKLNLVKLLTGCQTPNRYLVYEQDHRGQSVGNPIFACKEDSNCCLRQMCAASCKPFDLHVHKCSRASDDPFQGSPMVLHLQRECKCTFLCCNRPEMKVNYVENGQSKYLGKVVDEFACCNFVYKIYDEKDQEKYHIEANCCQLGFMCNCPCESCQTLQFDLFRVTPSGRSPLAPIMKHGKKNCCRNMLGENTNFAVPFITDMAWEDKCLLMAAALLIEYMQFEERPDKNQNQNNTLIDHS